MSPITSSRKHAEMHDIWQFATNLNKMEDNFGSVWDALEIDLLNALLYKHYLQHSQIFALKNRMHSPN